MFIVNCILELGMTFNYNGHYVAFKLFGESNKAVWVYGSRQIVNHIPYKAFIQLQTYYYQRHSFPAPVTSSLTTPLLRCLLVP